MPRDARQARDLLRRLGFALGLLAVIAALLAPWVLARAGRQDTLIAPEAALIAQRSDGWTPDPPCPLSGLPAHRACSPTR